MDGEPSTIASPIRSSRRLSRLPVASLNASPAAPKRRGSLKELKSDHVMFPPIVAKKTSRHHGRPILSADHLATSSVQSPVRPADEAISPSSLDETKTVVVYSPEHELVSKEQKDEVSKEEDMVAIFLVILSILLMVFAVILKAASKEGISLSNGYFLL